MTNLSSVPIAEKDLLDQTLYIDTNSVTKQMVGVQSIRPLIAPSELASAARLLECVVLAKQSVLDAKVKVSIVRIQTRDAKSPRLPMLRIWREFHRVMMATARLLNIQIKEYWPSNALHSRFRVPRIRRLAHIQPITMTELRQECAQTSSMPL
jgi:hypothetical protein